MQKDKLVTEYYKYEHMNTWKEIFEAMTRSIPEVMEKLAPTPQDLVVLLYRAGVISDE